MIAALLAVLLSTPSDVIYVPEPGLLADGAQRSPEAWSSPVPFDPKRWAMMCVESDPPKAEERAKRLVREGEIVLWRPRSAPANCTRCLARGKDGKPVELDPLVCDSLHVGVAR